MEEHGDAEDSSDEPVGDDDEADKLSDAGSVSSSDSEDSTLKLSSLGMLELREECRKRGLAQYGSKQGMLSNLKYGYHVLIVFLWRLCCTFSCICSIMHACIL
jgi:hypothetical protein